MSRIHRREQPYGVDPIEAELIADPIPRVTIEGVQCAFCGYIKPQGGRCPQCHPESTPADRKEAKASGRDDTAFHFDAGKSRVDVLPTHALEAIGVVFGYGAAKYGEWNWARHADEWEYGQLYASALRHLFAWARMEDIDPESNLPHLAHAGCNILMLMQLIIAGKGQDDRNPMYEDEWTEPIEFEPMAQTTIDYWEEQAEEGWGMPIPVFVEQLQHLRNQERTDDLCAALAGEREEGHDYDKHCACQSCVDVRRAKLGRNIRSWSDAY